MPEALTESFCERCGTRYQLTAPTRLNPLRRTRGVVSGLRNYILSQDGLADSVGDGLRAEEDALNARQLDAFHAAFNFCIECRQYTCLACWNDAAGRCRSCAPVAEAPDDLGVAAGAGASGPLDTAATIAAAESSGEWSTEAGLPAAAWPSADLRALAAGNGVARTDPVGGEVPSVADQPGSGAPAEEGEVPWYEREALWVEPTVTGDPVTVEPVLPAARVLEPASGDVPPEELVASRAPVDDESRAAADTLPPPEPVLRLLSWDDDVRFELEPEPIAAVEAAPEPEPIAAAAEAAPEPEPEPIAAAAESEVETAVEPMPLAPAAPRAEPPRPITPIRETILHFPPQRTAAEEAPSSRTPAAPSELDPVAAARRAQLDDLGLGDPGRAPILDRPQVLPYRSSGAGVHPAELAAAVSAAASIASRSFWDASARQVASAAAAVGVQNCGQCGLQLSASARFCRRCGTRQARSV